MPTPNPNQPPPPPPNWLLSLKPVPEPLRSKPILATYRLIRHFNGNHQAADRLLRSMQAKYPDKPEQWILDKVAWDLWRDRGM